MQKNHKNILLFRGLENWKYTLKFIGSILAKN